MTIPKRLARAEAALREHALAYPDAYEEFPWGERALKVKGKVFLFLYLGKDFLSLSLKLPMSGRDALTLPFAAPTGYGLGKSGWVTCRFEPNESVPLDMLNEWIDESFRAIAPRKLVGQLEDAEDSDQPPARAARSASKPSRTKKRTPRAR